MTQEAETPGRLKKMKYSMYSNYSGHVCGWRELIMKNMTQTTMLIRNTLTQDEMLWNNLSETNLLHSIQSIDIHIYD